MTAAAYPARITVRDGRIEVRGPYALKEALRAAGGRWDPDRWAWTFRATPTEAGVVARIVARSDRSPEFAALVDRAATEASIDRNQKYEIDAPEIPGLTGQSWAHQRQAYADAMSRPATMLALGLGAGKSRTAIGCILNRDVKRVLILCPLSVVPVWPAEIAKHAGLGRFAKVLELSTGSVAAKTVLAREWLARASTDGRPLVVVVNYDAARAEPFRSWSLGAGFDMVICDEIHKIKAAGGVTSRYVAALGKQARYRLGLTGTPMSHSPLDIYAQYRFLDPNIFGTSKVRFDLRYAVKGGYENHEVIGYQNIEDLNRKYHSIAFQVGREVLDLPDATDVTRYCELGPEGKRVYRELSKNLWAKLDSGEITAANAMTALLRLQQLTGGYLSDDAGTLNEVDHAKRDLLREVLDEIGPDESVVVFCRFRRDLDTVREVAGPDTLELSGRVNQLAEWQAGAGRVLCVQIQAGNTGISLVRACYNVLYSVGFSLSDYDQALARVHRPGQSRPVTNVKLVARNTVDERVYQALSERRDVVEAVLSRRERM